MADLNEGTRQRNLRRLSGSASAPNQLRNLGGGVPGPSTDFIQALGGHIGGWWIENQRLTADGGSAKLNANVPSISLGAATGYSTGAGIWFGKDSLVYKARIGDPAGHCLQWDGSTLTVVGTISATAGEIGHWTIGTNRISADSGAAVIDASVPKITLGAASDFFVGQGVFMGKHDGAYSFHVGNPPSGNYLAFDGATGALTLKGSVTTDSLNPALQSFTTNIVFSSTDNNTVSWTAGTIRLASGVTYAINAGNTGNMTALTYIYLDIAVSTTALQTTMTYGNAVGDGRLLVAAAQNHGAGSAGASVIPYTGQQPIINGGDQIAARSILAGQIAAGTITGSEITGSTLAAIRANIGAANISDVLTIGVSGGIYQGTGTFASPTTGLKVWNDGGVGRLATYLSGTPQVYFDTSGVLNAGGGNVKLDANGVALAQDETNTWGAVRWLDGATEIGSVRAYTKVSLGTRKLQVKALGYNLELQKGEIELLAQSGNLAHTAGLVLEGNTGASTATISADTITINGGLNLGTATGAPIGGIKASATISTAGGINVGTASSAGVGAGFFSAGIKALGDPGSLGSALGVDNVRLGIAAGTARIDLEDAGSTLWEIDNSAGTLRFYNPGAVRMSLDTSGNLAISGSRFRIATGNPVIGSADAGTVGDIRWGSDYIYVCVAANTWKRTQIFGW